MPTKVKYCNEKCNDNSVNTSNFDAPLDTLAQLGTEYDFGFDVYTNLDDKKTLLKRARRKFLSNGLVIKLVTASENNEKSVLRKSYWNSYHCVAALQLKSSGKIVGKYCKCKWCMVCNAIKTAVHIKQYTPVIEEWEDAHFVTLTQKTVPEDQLVLQINEMQKIFKATTELAKKNYQRGKTNFKLVGIRKLECTYRPLTKLYHPHYHIVVETKEMADYIRNQWLVRNCNAKSQGQDIRKANTGAIKELFKYMTKVIVNTSKSSSDGYIDAHSLDVIFNSFRKRRVLQNFGFKLPAESKCITSKDVDKSEVISVLTWIDNAHDWVDMNTGELLTGYTPTDSFKKLVQ